MNVFCGCIRHASLIQPNVCSEIPRAEGTHPQKNRPGVIVCDAGAINAVTAPERERRGQRPTVQSLDVTSSTISVNEGASSWSRDSCAARLALAALAAKEKSFCSRHIRLVGESA